MSVRIGEVGKGLATNTVAAIVSASSAGVELANDARTVLSPVEARNYAALLVRAAEEVEHMRDRAARERRELELEQLAREGKVGHGG